MALDMQREGCGEGRKRRPEGCRCKNGTRAKRGKCLSPLDTSCVAIEMADDLMCRVAMSCLLGGSRYFTVWCVRKDARATCVVGRRPTYPTILPLSAKELRSAFSQKFTPTCPFEVDISSRPITTAAITNTFQD